MRAAVFLSTLLLAGLCAAYQANNNNRRGYNTDNDQQDQQNQQQAQKAKPFQAGQEYSFVYNGQIASGLEVSGPSNAPVPGDEQQQKAVTRIQALAKIAFESDQRATLRLERIHLGQLNEPIESPHQVKPMGMFEKKEINEKNREKLEEPLQFEYSNGVVQRIQFQSGDSTWSKNIKRAVLQLIQLNLQRQSIRSGASADQWGPESAKQQYQDEDQDQDQNTQQELKSFTVPEINIEGECQTTYTINRNKGQSYQQQQQSGEQQSAQANDQDDRQQQHQSFNVTKSINFKQCKQIADVGFGYQTQQLQPQCAKCQKEWYKQLRQQGSQQRSAEQHQLCEVECDPKEVKEQKLDRSTVLRFVLAGKGPEQTYAIKRAELISQYIYKNLRADNGAHSSTMQTIVAAELIFRSAQPTQGRQGGQRSFRAEQSTNNHKDTLLYDNEFDVEEKQFYMNGDENTRNSPFAEVEKVEQAQKILSKLTKTVSDKSNGIESTEVAHLQHLAELLRMCSVKELNEIFQKVGTTDNQSSQRNVEQQKAEQILAGALAIAGTRNTIKVLADKIKNSDVKPQEAAQALKSLRGLPAPSDKQAEIVLNLCQHDSVQRSPALKQACWLSFGAMVGELCQQTSQKDSSSHQLPVFGAQSGFRAASQQCQSEKKQKYQQAMMEQYTEGRTTYEKVLALKALGNAGIDTAVQQLEKIITDQRVNRIVRMAAIDALRRLQNQMPRKIQRVLLPIFQNNREQPQVRMFAFAMILTTTPEKPVMDQITYTLTKERSSQVQSIVYSAMKTLSQSKIPGQQEMAKHLKNTLKMANIDEEALQGSRIYQVPFYSDEQKEGAFLHLVSVFSNRNSILPNHIGAALHTLLNDEFELSTLKVGLTQQGIEQWYEGLIQSVLYTQSSKRNTRSQRSSTSYRKNNEDELRQIFSGLKVQSRRRSSYRDNEDDDQQQEQQQQSYSDSQNQPFAMFTVRIGDMDTSILPIDRQSMPKCLRSLANGERPNIAHCLEAMRQPKSFRSLNAMNLAEKSAKIPTSIGVPLRILQATPVLASIEAHVRVSNDASEDGAIKANLVVNPSVCLVHIQKMETWNPMISTGVQSSRALELNAPIQAEIQASSQGSLRATIKTPTGRTRLMGFHTLPTTCTRDFDSRAHLLKEPRCKAIQVPQLEQLQTEVDYWMGKHTTSLPIRIRGHVHRPSNLANYVEMVQLAMCSENHIHMYYEPESGNSATEIILRADASSFSKESKHGPALDNFYSKTHEFDNTYDQDFENMDNHDQGRSKLNSFLNKFQPQFYKHQLKLSAQTKGGRKEVKAQVTSSASCDAKFKYCRMQMDVERSPMYANENSEWTLRSHLQLLAPEAVSNVRQLQSSPSDKNQKLVVQGDVEWGSDHKQTINVRVQGQKAHSRQWRQQIDQFQGPQNMFQQKRSAFVNKFDVVAEYKLQSGAQSVFQRCLETLKGWNSIWNTESQQQHNGRDGLVRCTVVIDPITLQHANISVRMPSQTVRIASMELPIQMRPFALVRQSTKASHSASQLFSRITEGQGRAECSVDGKRVETFDDVLYKAPIGKCYSVLAKDCSNEDRPQFVVMMKSVGQKQDKKIKVITPEQTIECQPTQGSGSEKKLQCKVNGEEVNEERNGQGQQQQQHYNNAQTVEYTNDEQTDVTINVRGVQVRFGCWGSSGCTQQKAWIKLSSQYKESQCGLCGHYDDQAEDELRMANNKQTGDLQEFHRSFTLQDSQGDCSSQDQDQLYSKDNSRKFRQIGRDYQDEQDNQTDDDDEDQDFGFPTKAKNSKKSQKYASSSSESQQQDEDDQKWQAGAYHTDGSSSEEDQWGRGESQKRWKKQQQQSQSRRSNQQKQRGNNQQANNDDQTEGEEPVAQTQVQEYNHKVCFSIHPVRKCPQGSHPASTDEQDNRQRKVPFVCLDRDVSEVRQMQRQARKGVVLDMSNREPSFVETVREPSRCVIY